MTINLLIALLLLVLTFCLIRLIFAEIFEDCILIRNRTKQPTYKRAPRDSVYDRILTHLFMKDKPLVVHEYELTNPDYLFARLWSYARAHGWLIVKYNGRKKYKGTPTEKCQKELNY